MSDPFIIRTDGKTNKPDAGDDPISSLLDSLQDLSYRIRHHKGEGIDLIERYDFFVRNSNRGRGCTYAHKCRQLFLLGDYKDIKEKLLEVIYNIREVPGDENFGK